MDHERRRFARIPIRLTAVFKNLSSAKVQRTLTKDIGGEGMCLITEGTMEPGTKLEVEIKLPDRDIPIIAAMEVVWSRPVGEPRKSYELPTAETGVKFVRMDQKDLALVMQYARLNTLPPELGGPVEM